MRDSSLLYFFLFDCFSSILLFACMQFPNTLTVSTVCVCSSLFPDVINCMQTDNLELKKLVYLYLMNYAKTQPDMAIMAVNTFVKVRTGNNILV